MKKTSAFLYRFGIAFISFVSFLILTILTILAARYRVYISLDYKQDIIIHSNGAFFFLGLAVFCCILIFLARVLKRLSVKWIFLLGAAFYLAAGIYLVTHVDGSIHGDPEIIYRYVSAFNSGDYHGLERGYYFNRYPFQLGFLTFERILGAIRYDTRFFFLVNLVLVILTDFFLIKTAELVFERNELAVKYTAMLSFMFLPLFFLILWLYGQIPGLFFLVFSLYWAAWLLKGKGRTAWNVILMLIGIALACLVKSNYYIGVVALAIVFILHALHERKARFCLAAAAVIAAMILPPRILNQYYRQVSGIDFESSSTMMAHIAMGLQDNGYHKGGWYNGYTFDLYDEVGQDNARTEAAAKENIEERLSDLAAHPEKIVPFFGDKILSTWCAPLFESVWSGPLPHTGASVRGKILYSLYTNGHVYMALEFYMNLVLVLLYAGSLLFLFKRKLFHAERVNEIGIFPVLYLVGGFLFHLISETDPIYVPMYVYMLTPCLAYVLSKITCRPAAGRKMRGVEEGNIN